MIGTFPGVRSFLREFFLLRQAEAAARASAPRKPRAQALLEAAETPMRQTTNPIE